MIVIGELINGMYRDVAKAIANRETDVIQHLADEQVKAGALRLDVNPGPYSKDPVEDMRWLVRTIGGAVGAPLSIDSTRLDVIEAGLGLAKPGAMINSTTADDDRLDAVFALAKKYRAQVIGLTMDRTGVPDS
jgi:5-methyltetrahydrofolate corrinoid/iron sulfur protein methyltransferase